MSGAGGADSGRGDLRRLAANSGWTAATTLGRIAISAVQLILLSRLLGPADYGRLGELASVIGLSTTLFTVRAWEWLTRFASQALARGAHAEATAFVKLGLLTSFGVNLLAFACVQLVAPLAAARVFHDPQLTPYVRTYAVMLLVTFPNDACTAALRSLEELPVLARLGFGTGALRIGTVLVPAALGLGLRGVVIGYLVSEAITWFVTFFVVRRRLAERTGVDVLRADLSAIRPHRAALVEFVRAGFLSDTLRGAANHVGVMVLGNLHGEREVGFFRLASNFLDLGHKLVTVVAQASLPQLSVLAAERAYGRIEALIRRSTAVVGSGVIAAVLGAFVLAEPVLVGIAGEAYRPAARVLVLGTLGLSWGLSYWFAPLASAVGATSRAVALVAMHSAVRVALTFLLVPSMGARGVALADGLAAAAYVTVAFVVAARMRRGLGA